MTNQKSESGKNIVYVDHTNSLSGLYNVETTSSPSSLGLWSPHVITVYEHLVVLEEDTDFSIKAIAEDIVEEYQELYRRLA